MRRLKTEIITGGLSANTLYTAKAFANQFGVSLTPVREALLELEKDGLIRIASNVGFQVVLPTDRELVEAHELRVLVEVPTMANLAGRLTGSALEEAWRLCRLTQTTGESGDLVAYLQANRAFHRHLLEQAGNARITKLLDELREAQRKPVLRTMQQHGNLRSRGIEHEDILRAIGAGDRELVAKLTAKHLEISVPKARR